mmetsp:Transcript_13886/g.32764  ORF Transcript_13886/g.32764 Transcript_13886/m.32764 type:complete len:223 (+) Transcript_13886:551-1219(+)
MPKRQSETSSPRHRLLPCPACRRLGSRPPPPWGYRTGMQNHPPGGSDCASAPKKKAIPLAATSAVIVGTCPVKYTTPVGEVMSESQSRKALLGRWGCGALPLQRPRPGSTPGSAPGSRASLSAKAAMEGDTRGGAGKGLGLRQLCQGSTLAARSHCTSQQSHRRMPSPATSLFPSGETPQWRTRWEFPKTAHASMSTTMCVWLAMARKTPEVCRRSELQVTL